MRCTMDEIKTEINEAFSLLSRLSVSGDTVDLMAVVRSKLKRAVRMIDNLEKGETDGGQTN